VYKKQVQIPLEHYPFAVSSPQPSSTDVGTRKPGDKTTTFAIGTYCGQLVRH